MTLSVARDPADHRVLEAAVDASIDAVGAGDDDRLAPKSYERIPGGPARPFLELLNGERRRPPYSWRSAGPQPQKASDLAAVSGASRWALGRRRG